MRTAVLLPTYFRPAGLRRVLKSLKETSPSVVPVIVAEAEDNEAYFIAKEYDCIFKVSVEPKSGPKWNEALKQVPDFDAFVMGADDIYFTENWYEETLIVLESMKGSGVVSFNTPQHFLMTRDFLVEHNGGCFVCPQYSGWYCELEIYDRAKLVNKMSYADKAIVVHDWHGSATKINANKDYKIYKVRKGFGFPNTYASILI